MGIQEAFELYSKTGSGRIASPLDALGVGGQVTGIGMLIVFLVLVILMGVLIAMKYIFAPKEKAKKTAVAVKPMAKQHDEEDEGELIAVLTAAIAASLSTSTYNLQIKSYKRIASTAPAWNKAGLNETINSRF